MKKKVQSSRKLTEFSLVDILGGPVPSTHAAEPAESDKTSLGRLPTVFPKPQTYQGRFCQILATFPLPYPQETPYVSPVLPTVGTPLCPYCIAYRRAYRLIISGLFNKSL